MDLGTAYSPLILAIGTLLAMISLRNSDIATRARDNVKRGMEMNPDAPLALRQAENLLEQNKRLLFRYWSLSIVFIVFELILALVVSAAVIDLKVPMSAPNVLSVGLGAVGMFLLAVEFWSGPDTLRSHTNILADIVRYLQKTSTHCCSGCKPACGCGNRGACTLKPSTCPPA